MFHPDSHRSIRQRFETLLFIFIQFYNWENPPVSIWRFPSQSTILITKITKYCLVKKELKFEKLAIITIEHKNKIRLV